MYEKVATPIVYIKKSDKPVLILTSRCELPTNEVVNVTNYVENITGIKVVFLNAGIKIWGVITE